MPVENSLEEPLKLYRSRHDFNIVIDSDFGTRDCAAYNDAEKLSPYS